MYFKLSPNLFIYRKRIKVYCFSGYVITPDDFPVDAVHIILGIRYIAVHIRTSLARTVTLLKVVLFGSNVNLP